MFTVSALATTLFLGGWQAPWPLGGIIDGMFNEGWWPVLWFTGQALALHVRLRLAARLAAAAALRPVHALRLEVPHPGRAARGSSLRRVRPRDAAVRRRRPAQRDRRSSWLAIVAVGLGGRPAARSCDGAASPAGGTGAGGRGASADGTTPTSRSADPFAGGFPVPPMPRPDACARTARARRSAATARPPDAAAGRHAPAGGGPRGG